PNHKTTNMVVFTGLLAYGLKYKMGEKYIEVDKDILKQQVEKEELRKSLGLSAIYEGPNYRFEKPSSH
ncbi:MAG: hypothetical protein MHPSP_001133, partial [Paramarteilia canceri]